jgi:hypothetical protein
MRKILKVNRVFLLLLVFTILFIFSVAFALEVNWPKSPLGTDLVASCSTTQATTSCDFVTLTKYFYEWGIALGGLATFVALVIAGFQYLTSMGEPARLAEARGKIRSAIFGLILLLGSWIILNTINPQLLSFNPITYRQDSLKISPSCTNSEDCMDNCIQANPQNPIECKKYDFTCINNWCSATLKQCDYVFVYSNTNFTGDTKKIEPGKREIIDNAKSLQGFLVVDGKEIQCSLGGCRCFVNLYAGGWFFGLGCGDLITAQVAYLPDIYSVADRPVKCIEVVSSSWPMF